MNTALVLAPREACFLRTVKLLVNRHRRCCGQDAAAGILSRLWWGVQVDRLAQSLMPANLRPLRSMLHATAVEVLLYLTPLHCQDMLDSVVLKPQHRPRQVHAAQPGL